MNVKTVLDRSKVKVKCGCFKSIVTLLKGLYTLPLVIKPVNFLGNIRTVLCAPMHHSRVNILINIKTAPLSSLQTL